MASPLKRQPKTDEDIVSRDDYNATAKHILRKYMNTDGLPHIHMRGGAAFGWNGANYEPAHDGAISRELWRVLGRFQCLSFDNNGKPVGTRPYNPSRVQVGNVLDALLANVPDKPPYPAPSWIDGGGDLPPADELFPMQNGLAWVRTGEFIPHTPRYFNTWVSPVTYDPKAKCPTWDAFVESAHEGRQDCIQLHQEIFGYYLISSTAMHKFAIIQGIPGTGKSVVLKTLKALIGDGGFAQLKMDQFGSRDTHAMAQAHNKAVLGVFDARIGPEMNNSSMMEALLSLPTGDGLPVRLNMLKSGSDSHGMCYAKPIIASNKVLRMPDAAIIQRIVLLCFNKVFRGQPGEVKGLDKLLMAELPGIVNWAIEGGKRLLARGDFVQPDYGEDIMGLFVNRADPFGGFIEKYLDVDPEYEAREPDIREIYNTLYKTEHDLQRPIKRDHMRELMFESIGAGRLSRIGNKRADNLFGEVKQGEVIRGVRIKPEAQELYVRCCTDDKGKRRSFNPKGMYNEPAAS